jgi:hypothetical protein
MFSYGFKAQIPSPRPSPRLGGERELFPLVRVPYCARFPTTFRVLLWHMPRLRVTAVGSVRITPQPVFAGRFLLLSPLV